jgi:glycosyltransferase involved in cell wall biosynthesis
MNIITEQLPPRFRWDPTAPVRGTEKFYVETARWLAALTGEAVKVYGDYLPAKDPSGITAIGDVKYIPRKPGFNNHFEAVVCNPRTRLSGQEALIWTNLAFDTTAQVTAWVRTLWECPEGQPAPIVCISEYQARVYRTCDLIADRVVVVGHGVDPGIFNREGRTGGKQVLFTSSPDRGWDYLQDLWRGADLEAETGYALRTLDYGGHSVTNEQVADALRASDFWVHPGRGVELFCISAIEAQACGTTPIVVPNGGLAETVRFGYRFPTEDFGQGLAAVLAGEATMRGIGQHAAGIPSWANVTAKLLDYVYHGV